MPPNRFVLWDRKKKYHSQLKKQQHIQKSLLDKVRNDNTGLL
jgi:hypothetical protein